MHGSPIEQLQKIPGTKTVSSAGSRIIAFLFLKPFDVLRAYHKNQTYERSIVVNVCKFHPLA